jgi:hypothetical protein
MKTHVDRLEIEAVEIRAIANVYLREALSISSCRCRMSGGHRLSM